MSVYKFDALKLSDLIALSLEHPDSDYDAARHQSKQHLTDLYTTRLVANAEMLGWFGVRIEDKCLVASGAKRHTRFYARVADVLVENCYD
jgi:hypothetical protein